MPATSRELVLQTLECKAPARAPRNLWSLPWAEIHHADRLREIRAEFPDDFVGAPVVLETPSPTEGDPYAVGRYRDAWGCVFENLQAGVTGEVRNPLVRDWAEDRVRIPVEELGFRIDEVNRFCDATDCFVQAGCCPRPFEQLQFLMGTENLLVELMDPTDAFLGFMNEMHAFYCRLAERWMKETRVDCLFFMDDWGSQQSTLIDPVLWRERFKPLYRDYIGIAHEHGKKAFMHSDGNILALIPDLIEIGLDALNAQIFCIGIEQLAPFAGRITFWGEIDRQNLLVHGSPDEIDAAVRRVHSVLWRDGGCIAQCEFGPGANPDNVREVFAAWQRLARE